MGFNETVMAICVSELTDAKQILCPVCLSHSRRQTPRGTYICRYNCKVHCLYHRVNTYVFTCISNRISYKLHKEYSSIGKLFGLRTPLQTFVQNCLQKCLSLQNFVICFFTKFIKILAKISIAFLMLQNVGKCLKCCKKFLFVFLNLLYVGQ